jgi:hypothetical protein
MRQPSYRSLPLLALLSLFPGAASAATAATLDLNQAVNPAAAKPVVIVRHDDIWHYRRGTNEPQGEWKTVGDSGLDTSWLTNAGGFGYGDPGITGENTTLSGMTGVHSTLYVRRTFTVTNDLDGNAGLRLLVDYDDGFVAYLDGIELTRANLTNGPGMFVAHHDTTVTSHEASCCDAPTHASEAFDVGPVGDRLPPGNHVLALIQWEILQLCWRTHKV